MAPNRANYNTDYKVVDLSKDIKFTTTDCMSGKEARFYSKSELNSDYVIKNADEMIKSFSRFGATIMPEPVPNKDSEIKDVSGIEVEKARYGEYNIKYISAKTLNRFFGSVLGHKIAHLSLASVEYQFKIRKINDMQIEISLNREPTNTINYSYNLHPIKHLGGSEEATKQDVENIFRNFQVSIPVNSVYSGKKYTLKTLYPRVESINEILLKNGYRAINKSSKNYVKTIHIGNGQSINHNVDVSCLSGSNCSVTYENEITKYYAYADGSCSITPNIFANESERLNANLKKILE